MIMNTQNKKFKISKERELNTYAEMWRVSYWTMHQAEKEVRGSYFQLMASLVFTAFTLEAYSNHLGKLIFTCWDNLERPFSPQTKMNLIAEKFKIVTDYNKRPFQTAKKLLKFRNDVAHGKSALLKVENEIITSSDDIEKQMDKPLEAEWEKYCTLKNAKQAREDIEKIIKQFHKSSKTKESLFFTGITSSSTSLMNE